MLLQWYTDLNPCQFIKQSSFEALPYLDLANVADRLGKPYNFFLLCINRERISKKKLGSFFMVQCRIHQFEKLVSMVVRKTSTPNLSLVNTNICSVVPHTPCKCFLFQILPHFFFNSVATPGLLAITLVFLKRFS